MADTTIKVTADTRDAERALGSLTSALKGLATITIGANVAKGLIDMTSTMQEMTNKLLSVSNNVGEANAKLAILSQTAMSTGSNLGGTVDLFQKLAQSTVFAGSSTDSLAKITERFNQTLQISGASGAAASSSLYQFAQAMQKGTLNGDEFRSMSENNGYMLKILQQELGKSSTELRMMASEGRLSAEVIAKALLNSDQIAQDYSKTIRTIPQAWENVQTSLLMTIKALDDASGASTGLVVVLNALANNMDIVVGAAAGLLAALAVGRIIAIAGAIMEIVAALRAMTIMEAMASGGLTLVLGAAAGVAAWKATGSAIEDANKALEDQKAKLDAGNKSAADGLVIHHQRVDAALKLDEALRQQIGTMNAVTAIEAKSNGMKSLQLEAEKAVAQEAEKYKKTGEAMPPLLAAQLAAATKNKILAEEHANTMKQIQDIQSNINVLGELDAGRARILGDLEKYRLGVTKETYDINRLMVEDMLKQQLAAEAENEISKQLLSNQREMEIIYAQTTVEQEQLRAIEDVRRRYGEEIANQYKDQVNESTKALVVAREIAGWQKENATASLLLNTYQGSINAMTAAQLDDWQQIVSLHDKLGNDYDSETAQMMLQTAEMKRQLEYLKQMKTNAESFSKPLTGAAAGAAASSQLGNLDPETAAKTQYQTMFNGIQELRNLDLINEDTYNKAKLALWAQNEQAMYDATRQRFENESLLRIQEQTNGKLGFSTQKQMAKDAADFQMKSDTEKYAFGLDQAAQMFTSLGTYNKQAFEAAKAFNIANAIMNAYLGATKALATYPPPFNFIAAAATVAMGLAQVAAIRSQSYSGRALGGPVMGGDSYIVGENGPEVFTPATSGSITRNDQLKGNSGTTVNFNITTVDATGFDRLLISRRATITGIIAEAQLEKGRRV